MIKKFIPFLLALAVMFCTMPMRGDSPPPPISYEIPIKGTGSHDMIRTLCDIQACYYGMLSAVCTSVASDLGEIDVTVTNCSTGELWEDTFDSSTESQHLIQISSTPGLYEVTYITESGDLYEGTFMIE